MNTNETQTWYTSTLDCGGISYLAKAYETDGRTKTLTVERVVFSRYNTTAHVREEVVVHWSEAFKWADYDPSGGLGLSAVIMSDGTKTFASGRYYGTGHPDANSRENSGLCEIIVGCYGSAWVKRAKRPVRNEHGFPIREAVAAS